MQVQAVGNVGDVTTLDLTVIGLADVTNGDPIPATDLDGTFTVVESPPAVVLTDVNTSLDTDHAAGIAPAILRVNDPVDVERARKIRKALNLAINRQEIVNTVYYGGADLMTALGFYRGSSWEDPIWEPHSYDPVLAQRLMVDALAGTRWQGGFNISFHIQTGNQPRMDAAEAVAVSISATDSLNKAEDLLIDTLYAPASTTFNLGERMQVSRDLGAFIYDNYLAV